MPLHQFLKPNKKDIMQDDSLPLPSGPEAPPAPYQNEVTVLGSTLSKGDVLPEIGDQVDLQVTGTVARISGDTFCITPTEVNGEPAPPVPPDEAEAVDNPQEEGLDVMREKLRAGAMADDSKPMPY